ncbi:MAG TPA: ribokinase [Aeromicrobium sp.]|nr:ribokinase [Aeromicrobium sp.]
MDKNVPATPPIIAVVGSYGAGLTMRVPRVPVAGETLSGGVYSPGPGGKGSNQAIGAARLGADVTFLTAIGDDDLGQGGRQLWQQENVDATSVVTIDGVSTMAGFIMVEPSGENRIIIAAGALDHLEPVHVETFRPQLTAADLVVVSLEIPVPAALAALQFAHESGVRTLLNPAPAQPIPAEAWQFVDVLTPNQTEAKILLGLDPDAAQTPSDLSRELRGLGVGTVVITLGGDGCLVNDADGIREVPAVEPVRVVDTTGAGDCFTAALAVSLAEGHSIDEATKFAARAGAHSVAIAEVINSLPYRSDLPD